MTLWETETNKPWLVEYACCGLRVVSCSGVAVCVQAKRTNDKI